MQLETTFSPKLKQNTPIKKEQVPSKQNNPEKERIKAWLKSFPHYHFPNGEYTFDRRQIIRIARAKIKAAS